MGSGSVSARINLEQSRKQAKDLLKAHGAGDPAALEKIRWNHPRLHGMPDHVIRESEFRLADAQLVIARWHRFESWPRLLRYIDTLEREDPRVSRFEEAADAVVSGDLPGLRGFLDEDPQLTARRSTRSHEAPLLHYTTANGVEDYRQRTPANAVEIARLLLDHGAEVDAVSEAYGGGSTALYLLASSTPPRRAGVQISLIDLFLERGAAIEGVAPGKTPLAAALANGCPEAARALVERGARVPDVVTAAGVGRLDLVREHAASARPRDLEQALMAAAGFPGATGVVQYLLDRGVDITVSDGMTALHRAVANADLRMIDLLVRRGAPLEEENMYGGTVLAHAIWHGFHGDADRIRDYAAVLDALIAAGARTDAYPEMEDHIEEIRRRALRV